MNRMPRMRMVLITMMVAMSLSTSLAGCSHNTRATTIRAALVTAQAADAGLVAFDGPHELALVNGATDRIDAERKLADYRAKRDKVLRAVVAVFEAIAVASTVNDDQSIAVILAASLNMKKLIVELEGP